MENLTRLAEEALRDLEQLLPDLAEAAETSKEVSRVQGYIFRLKELAKELGTAL